METKDSEIRIMAVGDIMLGMAYPSSIANKDDIPTRLKNHSSSLVGKKITNFFKQADIVFGNLECVISEEFENYKSNSIIEKPKLVMAPLEAIPFLKNNNFDILNLANNHILDHGKNKVSETIQYLEESKIGYIGDPFQSESELNTISIKGKKIGFVGYNLCVKEKEKMKKKIIEDVKEKEGVVDIIVISLHWGLGFEQMKDPAPTQIDFGRQLIDIGADIILGHHSHVFQPVERYKGKVIAYSLGNFVFDMWNEKNLKSGILDIKISQTNKVKANIIPTSQNNYHVSLDKEESRINDIICDNLDIKKDIEEFKIRRKKIKRTHYKEFLVHYFSNLHKLPLKYHCYILTKWCSKLKNKFFRT